MANSTVTCADCDKKEEYILKPGYPRKYCAECSAIRTAKFNNKGSQETEKPATKAKTLMKTDEPKIAGRDTSFYVAYAKDVFIAMYPNAGPVVAIDKLMNDAILLVKQAKDAFS